MINWNSVYASLGNEARKLVKRNPEDPTVVCFLTASATAYKNCVVYSKEKLLLLNSTLKAFSALGPCMILSKKDSVTKYLIELPDVVSVFTEKESKLYEIQVRKMMVDNTLPAAADGSGDNVDIVKWYSHLLEKYPVVHKMAMSVLFIFHRPSVESSFSKMVDVIDKKANQMCDRTYSIIQTVKYCMRAQSPNSNSSRTIHLFKRQDKHYTLVSWTLVSNMRNAHSLQKQTQCLKRKQLQDMDIEFENEMNHNKKAGSRGERQ